jgi:hypothetical protein
VAPDLASQSHGQNAVPYQPQQPPAWPRHADADASHPAGGSSKIWRYQAGPYVTPSIFFIVAAARHFTMTGAKSTRRIMRVCAEIMLLRIAVL